MSAKISALLLPLLLSSCNDTGVAPVPQELSASTEQSQYAPGETIRVSFHNFGNRELDLESCCYAFACYIDIQEGGTWKELESRGLPCMLLCPGIRLTVNPDQTFVDSLTIGVTGVFRLRVPYSSPTAMMRPIKDMEVTTNSFTIQPIRLLF